MGLQASAGCAEGACTRANAAVQGGPRAGRCWAASWVLAHTRRIQVGGSQQTGPATGKHLVLLCSHEGRGHPVRAAADDARLPPPAAHRRGPVFLTLSHMICCSALSFGASSSGLVRLQPVASRAQGYKIVVLAVIFLLTSECAPGLPPPCGGRRVGAGLAASCRRASAGRAASRCCRCCGGGGKAAVAVGGGACLAALGVRAAGGAWSALLPAAAAEGVGACRSPLGPSGRWPSAALPSPLPRPACQPFRLPACLQSCWATCRCASSQVGQPGTAGARQGQPCASRHRRTPGGRSCTCTLSGLRLAMLRDAAGWLELGSWLRQPARHLLTARPLPVPGPLPPRSVLQPGHRQYHPRLHRLPGVGAVWGARNAADLPRARACDRG